MSNWCLNNILVQGNAADISEFKEWLGEGEGLLNKILPTPQGLREAVSRCHGDPEEQKILARQRKANLDKYGSADWYDWNLKNWGTKGDVDCEMDESNSFEDQVFFSFRSSWTPPQPAVSLLAAKFNMLNFRHTFLEEGCGFVGYVEYENGKAVNDVYNDDSESAEWKELASKEFGWEPFED